MDKQIHIMYYRFWDFPSLYRVLASYDQTHNESIIQGLDHRSFETTLEFPSVRCNFLNLHISDVKSLAFAKKEPHRTPKKGETLWQSKKLYKCQTTKQLSFNRIPPPSASAERPRGDPVYA